MKFRRNRQRENIDINLASLIDVVFVLLLFFVVTTTFTRETQLRVELPEAVSAEHAPADQGKLVEITISAEGVYSVNNHLLPKSDLATLSEAIERESGGDNKLPLAISADGKTPHQAVVTAMDAAGKLGFSQLRMTTVEAAQAAPLMTLADRLLAAWYAGHPALALLRPLEALYRCVVKRKRARFLSGEQASYRAPVPVIVVGNITVGGTGKTPMILWLIEHCRQRGLRAGVVSRGYGAKPPQLPWRVMADQAAEHAGDEPLLIVQRTGVPLMIDPDRSRAVQALLASEPLDLILCDDGMQHYRLARDLELVLIDAARGLGNRRCLPAGPLREPVERLEEADAVLLNGAGADSAAGFGFSLQPSALVNLRTGERRGLDHFPAGQRLHAVAGIGNPQRFFDTLLGLNWQPLPHPFADHAQFSAQSLAFTPVLPLVMTEKDAVKCRSFAAENWWYLAVEAQPTPAFSAWFDNQLHRLLGKP